MRRRLGLLFAAALLGCSGLDEGEAAPKESEILSPKERLANLKALLATAKT